MITPALILPAGTPQSVLGADNESVGDELCTQICIV